MILNDWGLTDYKEAVQLQLQIVAQRIRDEVPNTLIFTEHRPVFTLGAGKGAVDNLLWNASMREMKGIALVKANRGGDITYHGPGQLVAYPIIKLRKRNRDLHRYLRDLEEVVISALGFLGLAADRRQGMTGIWFGTRKIAAIGVAVRSWVTYHGTALNVTHNLGNFDGIIPCGITDCSVTSLEAELMRKVMLDEVKSVLALEFRKRFADH